MLELDAFRGVARLYVDGVLRTDVAGGYLDDASRQPCGPGTRFQLASVSKQFTAAVVLLLSEGGALTLDDPVSGWFDRCPEAWQTMTIRHLLNHTSGLPHWRDIPQLVLTREIDGVDEIEMFMAAPLRATPGSQWYYSSPGYVLLAHIAERASGRRYGALLLESIFDPLGMSASFTGNAHGRAETASGYCASRPVESFELDVVGMGAGDVWTSAEDLARWNESLLASSLLSPPSLAGMFGFQASIDPPQATVNALPQDAAFSANAYGLGWFLGSFAGSAVAFHPGDNFGFAALNLLLPERAISAFMMSNEEASAGLGLELVTQLLSGL